MQRQAHVIIAGSVQGVGMRSWIRAQALGLGLVGWVKNRKDDCVEAVFEGDKKTVREMITYCKKGPETGWVEDVRVEWREAKERFTDFEIKH